MEFLVLNPSSILQLKKGRKPNDRPRNHQLSSSIIFSFLRERGRIRIQKETAYKMTIKTVIDIRQPVAEVFKELVNPDNMPKWIEGFVRLEKVKGRRPRRGSISTQIHKDSKGQMELREEILLFERNKKFEIRLSHKNMDTKQSYEFVNQGKSMTRVILVTQTRLIPAFIAIFSVFMKGGMKRQQEANLMRFKKLMEK